VARTTVLATLRLRQTASSPTITAGQSVSFHLRLVNHSAITLHHLRTCDRLPAGLIYLGASSTPARSLGRYCWTAATLAGHGARSYAITAQAPLGHGERVTNTATATATGARPSRATARVRVLPRLAIGCSAGARAPAERTDC
jgi:uncharacterized repeat protein (TIGR01451 family)